MVPFEEITYLSEPVVTIAIEPKRTKDLPRLLGFLENITKSDPNLIYSVNEQTGENLLSGLGLLHLEIAIKDIEKAGIAVYASDPIVLYRETVKEGITLGKYHQSPNGRNSLRISVNIPSEEFDELTLWQRDSRGNLLVNQTDKTIPSNEKNCIVEGFNWAMESGPLCGEPIGNTLIQIIDIQLSPDPAERSRVELMSLMREAIFLGFSKAGTALLEPIYHIEVSVPADFQKETAKVIMSKRGNVEDMKFKEEWVSISGSLPVSESFDLADTLRSNTAGKAIWQTKFARWQVIPENRANEIIQEIRKRRGMS
jgi:elongation factor 2